MSRRRNKFSRIIRDSLAQTLSKIRTLEIFTITKVEISPDLKIAHIWISIINSQQENWDIKQLNQYFPIFIENLKKLNLRYLPKLYFHKDESGKIEEKINKLIQKIHES